MDRRVRRQVPAGFHYRLKTGCMVRKPLPETADGPFRIPGGTGMRNTAWIPDPERESVIRVGDLLRLLKFPQSILQLLDAFPGPSQDLLLHFELFPCCQVHTLEVTLDGGIDIAPQLLCTFRRKQPVDDVVERLVQLPAPPDKPTYSMNAC